MVVPKLRFKEFKDEWKITRIQDLFYISAGGDINKNNVSKEKTNLNNIPIYANSLENRGLYGYTNTYKVSGNTITVTGRGDIGYAIARNESYYPIVRLLVLKPKINLNNIFFATAINNINLIIESTGVPQLTAPQISKYFITYPKLKEQEKIAKFLSLLDKKIELQQRKIAALKIYKIGLLDKIYKEEMKEIKEEEIKKYAYLQGGYAFKSELFSKNGIPIIRIANINENIVDLKDIVCYDEENPIDSKFEINTGDILIAMSGATTGKIGIYKETMKSYLNQRVGKIVLKEKDIIYSYLYFLFELSSYNMQLNTKLVAGAQPNISPSDIETLKFKVPSIKMQEHIANITMNINRKLETESNKLQQLNKLNKGLLQKMFI